MECAQVTEEQRLWTETQIQKAKHNAWPSCLASVYLTVISVWAGRFARLGDMSSPDVPALESSALDDLDLDGRLAKFASNVADTDSQVPRT